MSSTSQSTMPAFRLPPPPARHRHAAGDYVASLVDGARQGDELAWTELVTRFDRTLRQVARSYRLSGSDVDDVVQNTWIRLFDHLDRLCDPSAVRAWLVTTARRESLRCLQRHMREFLTPEIDELAPPEDDALSQVLAAERGRALHDALAMLSPRHRALISLLIDDRCRDYGAISAQLGMPVGSIGPIRARSLERLGQHPELQACRN